MAGLFATLFAAFALTTGAVKVYAAETAVFLRHDGKPALGLGQLSCQGLNARRHCQPWCRRSRHRRRDSCTGSWLQSERQGIEYHYVRPLATIEPTAIRLRLRVPVNTTFGLTQLKRLGRDLLRPSNSAATIYVAWEHNLA